MLNTMKPHAFEIRIAIIGYVSVGKSTVLNALLGDRFSEVSLKRTTAGVNLFRVSQPSETAKAEKLAESNNQQAWTFPENDNKFQGADEIHQKISGDNVKLRSSNVVKERFFDIEAEYDICNMPSDTKLILIDIPGMNEAETSKKYKDYVESKWDTFDCVVVVMDAIQGVNTEEQVQLLHFVKQNNLNFKDIPTVVLGNKMDDFYDEDTIQLIRETHSKTIEIFGAVDFQFTHHPVGNAINDTSVECNTVFIPLSAKNAFTYRRAGKIDLGELGNAQYHDLVNKIGHDEYGRKWSVFSMKKRIEAVSQVLEDPKELSERLGGTNFQAFLLTLTRLMGNDAAHKEIFSNQINAELHRISAQSGREKSISASIRDIFNLLGPSGRTDKDNSIYTAFWSAYDQCERKAFEALEEDVSPKALERPIMELEEYNTLASELEWLEESQNTIVRMQKLLGRQLSILSQKIENWRFRSFCEEVGVKINETDSSCCRRCSDNHCGRLVELTNFGYSACDHWCFKGMIWWPSEKWSTPKKTTWNNLSPQDWITILSSLSLVWNQMGFVEEFGPARAKLGETLSRFHLSFDATSETFTRHRRFSSNLTVSVSDEDSINFLLFNTYNDAVSRLEANKGAIFKVEMPKRLDNPRHWGYLAWKYLKFWQTQDRI